MRLLHLGSENLLDLAVLRDLVPVLPVADGKTRKVCRSESGRLDGLGSVNYRAYHIRLDLEQDIADARAAVDTKLGECYSGVVLHRLKKVGHLIGDSLEDASRDMSAVDSARESDYAAARIHIPVGRAESRERGDKIYTVCVGHALGELVAALCVVYHMQLVAKPFYDRASVECRALNGIFDLVADTPCDAREQVVL